MDLSVSCSQTLSSVSVKMKLRQGEDSEDGEGSQLDFGGKFHKTKKTARVKKMKLANIIYTFIGNS